MSIGGTSFMLPHSRAGRAHVFLTMRQKSPTSDAVDGQAVDCHAHISRRPSPDAEAGIPVICAASHFHGGRFRSRSEEP